MAHPPPQLQVFKNKKVLLQPQAEMERHLTDLIKVRPHSHPAVWLQAVLAHALPCPSRTWGTAPLWLVQPLQAWWEQWGVLVVAW